MLGVALKPLHMEQIMSQNQARIAQLEHRRNELMYRIAQWDGTWMRATTLTRTDAVYHAQEVAPDRAELAKIEAELESLGWTHPLTFSDYVIISIVIGVAFALISQAYFWVQGLVS